LNKITTAKPNVLPTVHMCCVEYFYCNSS